MDPQSFNLLLSNYPPLPVPRGAPRGTQQLPRHALQQLQLAMVGLGQAPHCTIDIKVWTRRNFLPFSATPARDYWRQEQASTRFCWGIFQARILNVHRVVFASITVGKLKRRFELATAMPASLLTCIYNGRVLLDDQKLYHLDLPERQFLEPVSMTVYMSASQPRPPITEHLRDDMLRTLLESVYGPEAAKIIYAALIGAQDTFSTGASRAS